MAEPVSVEAAHRDLLLRAAARFGTPLYVYDFGAVAARFRELDRLFGHAFGVSYAVKSNPNLELMRLVRGLADGFDASSIAEVEQSLAAGMAASHISFSGPAKRPEEIDRAVELGIGELVLESPAEAVLASRAAQRLGRRQPVLVRLNPLRMPRRMGASMGGSASQFGIDEEAIGSELPAIAALPGLELIGFHVYSGSNCLDAAAIVENFEIMIDLMRRARAATGIDPLRLIFGSGFGVPYTPDDRSLDVEAVAAAVLPMMAALKAEPGFAAATCTLEMGRWLVGEAGWLLASVVAEKTSRGVELRMLDAGFNSSLAAWGMMGSVIRRNWRIANLSNPAGPVGKFTLAGPLCTTIDRLASNAELPALRVGDMIAIAGLGAYGLSASPTRFISHPEAREVAIVNGALRDISGGLPVAARPVPAEPQRREGAA